LTNPIRRAYYPKYIDDTTTGQDGAPKITADVEVTEEMKRAGAKVLADAYDSVGDGVDGLIAEEVFRAMRSASRF
jgi:hypothetical protein